MSSISENIGNYIDNTVSNIKSKVVSTAENIASLYTEKDIEENGKEAEENYKNSNNMLDLSTVKSLKNINAEWSSLFNKTKASVYATDLQNMLNTVLTMYTGSMGQTDAERLIGSVLNTTGTADAIKDAISKNEVLQNMAKLGLDLNVSSVISAVVQLAGIDERIPTLTEIEELMLCGHSTMYTTRPGKQIKSMGSGLGGIANFVTETNGKDIGSISTEKYTTEAQDESLYEGVKNSVTSILNVSSVVTKVIEDSENDIKSSIKSNDNTVTYLSRTDDTYNSVLDANYENNLNKEINYGYSEENSYYRVGMLKKNKNFADILQERGKRTTEDRSLGGLYLKPYYDGDKIQAADFIPFEFNPEISEGSMEAKYATDELVGRLLTVRSYIGGDSETTSIETTYIATHPDKDEDTNDIGESWANDWTPAKLREIEKKYRKLVLPYIDSEQVNFKRPVLVKIKFGSKTEEVSTVNDLFKYPGETKEGSLSNTDKTYIVTSVKITPHENFQIAYNFDKNGNMKRTGFKVNITLAETTKMFTDVIPSYEAYSK